MLTPSANIPAGGQLQALISLVWGGLTCVDLLCRLHTSVLAQQPGSQQAGWQAAAASLLNTHQYFGQFQPRVEQAIADSMAPLNKQLEAS